MAEELDLYTGTLLFRDINFTFAFDKKDLRLIPPEDKARDVVWNWHFKEIKPGVSTFADPIPVEEPYLIGECNETNCRIVFIPEQGSMLGLNNHVVHIPLAAIIVCKYNREAVDKISFSCPEINYIHPVNQAIILFLPNEEVADKGTYTISTRTFNETTTEKQTFRVDEKEMAVCFGISRSISTQIHEPPLRMDSSMMFEFEATNDYHFIYRLWRIGREFIRFLCYRDNVYIPKVELSAPYEGGKHEKFATMFILNQEGEAESDTLKKGRYIRQEYIAGHEGEILSDIAKDNIYLRHLPESYRSGRHIDAARFVMITAAFEWEFHRLYPNGIEKSKQTLEAEAAVSECIQKHIDETSGKQKEKYKFLKRLIASDSLQAEIIQMGKDFSEIIGKFGEHLYHINNEELKYSEMGERLSNQRNHFAHGDLDKEFIGTSLLDLIFMEYVIYAMQLKYYGVEDINIRKSINELFHLNYAISN